MRGKNIFYNVLKNETSLTEVMCNLMSYKTFRDLFIELVNTKRTEENILKNSLISYDNFGTEKDFGDDKDCCKEREEDDNKIGRGDLILNYNEENIIFELKVEKFTKLTKNQPSGYLCYLKNQNQNAYNDKLYFILPKGYMHIEDIYSKWLHYDSSYSKELIKNRNIIYWEDILDEIKERELHKINPIIEAFCEILDYRWFYMKPFYFSENEIEFIFQEHNTKNEELSMVSDTNIPRIMHKLYDIVENVKIEPILKENRQNSEWYGYYVSHRKYDLPEKIDIWYGITYEIWENRNAPLMIQVDVCDDEELEEKIAKELNLKKYIYKEEDIPAYILLIPKEFFNKENITSLFQEKIQEVINKIREITKESD
jgi:hypothetical protein